MDIKKADVMATRSRRDDVEVDFSTMDLLFADMADEASFEGALLLASTSTKVDGDRSGSITSFWFIITPIIITSG